MVTQSEMARMERSLSPRQAALHFYTPVLRAETPAAYAVAVYDALEADPLDRRLQRIDGATGAALRGASREAVEKAQRDARLEHYFVCRLIDTANQHAAQQWEAWTLRALLTVNMAEKADRLLGLIDGATATGRRHGGSESAEELPRCSRLAAGSRTVYTGTLRAVELVSDRYAGGGAVLFAGAREALRFGEECTTLLEQCCSIAGLGATITAPDAVEEWAEELARGWIEQVRCDVDDARGRHDATLAYVAGVVNALRPPPHK